MSYPVHLSNLPYRELLDPLPCPECGLEIPVLASLCRNCKTKTIITLAYDGDGIGVYVFANVHDAVKHLHETMMELTDNDLPEFITQDDVDEICDDQDMLIDISIHVAP